MKKEIKLDYRSRCGMGFRHFLNTPEEMTGYWNPNVSHSHPQYEVFYLVSGKCTYTVANKKYELNPGDVICLQCFQNHSIAVDPNQDYERYVLEFEMSNIPTLNGVSPLYDYFNEDTAVMFLPSKFIDNSNLLTIFKSMEKTCLHRNRYTNHLLLGDVIKLITLIRINYQSAENTDITTVSANTKYEIVLNKISNYINQNIKKKITIDDIAKNVYLSRSYLQHTFKQYVGMSITDYIFQQKMHIAKFMLQNGSSLSEVSDALGYKYYSTFCMHYKKFYGRTPKNHG